MNRYVRRLASWLLIATVLCAQLAMSAYACPSLLKSGVAIAPNAAESTMAADCDMMLGMLDPAAPALCAAYSHNHEQSSDHAAAPALPPALFAALYWLLPAFSSEPACCAPEAIVLHAALPPPHAILHCCFRI